MCRICEKYHGCDSDSTVADADFAKCVCVRCERAAHTKLILINLGHARCNQVGNMQCLIYVDLYVHFLYMYMHFIHRLFIFWASRMAFCLFPFFSHVLVRRWYVLLVVCSVLLCTIWTHIILQLNLPLRLFRCPTKNNESFLMPF